MNNINEILSDDLKIPPLVGDEKKEFRLAIFGTIDPITEQPVRKPGYTLAGIDRIIDHGDNNNQKLIFNIVDYEPIKMPGGNTVMQPKPGYLTFDGSGIIICTALDNDKYFYLKRHNKNRDNPFRNRKKPIIFYEVNEERDIKISRNSFEYRIHAGGFILQAEERELLDLAGRLNAARRRDINIPSSLRGESLRQVLQPLSQTHPELVLLFSGNEELVARVIVDYAILNQWIIFNDHAEVMTWNWMRTPGKSGKVSIVKVESGDDPRKFLVSYIITKAGSMHYAELRQKHMKEFNYADVV
jgi:hypothetical protein